MDLNNGSDQDQDGEMELRRGCRGSWVGDKVTASVSIGPEGLRLRGVGAHIGVDPRIRTESLSPGLLRGGERAKTGLGF